MLALYTASVTYIDNEVSLLGAGHDKLEESQKARVRHFVSSLSSLAVTLEDAAAVQAQLNVGTSAFTDAQRKDMSIAVAMRMQSNSDPSAGVQGSVGSTKLQVAQWIADYLPNTKWLKYRDPQVSFNDKKEDAVDFLLDIGCPHPNDDIVKDILAILMICHELKAGADEAYSHIHDLRTKLVNKRLVRSVAVAMHIYP